MDRRVRNSLKAKALISAMASPGPARTADLAEKVRAGRQRAGRTARETYREIARLAGRG